MPTYQHPASLGEPQRYKQACAILRQTNRASHAAWYLEALDQDHQLHIRWDGQVLGSYFYDRKSDQWSKGPALPEDCLTDVEGMPSCADKILAHARAEKARALGVILHIADEFATTELKPELDNPGALSELRETAIHDPSSILDDSSVPADQNSWRVIPYLAAGSETIGTTVTISRQFAPFLEALRELAEKENFPIITHALSAPLVALLGIADATDLTPGRPFVTVLQYPWLTVMAFFSGQGDLRLIRTLHHRGMRRPTNFRNSISTTNASLEFEDPDIFVAPLGKDVDASLALDLRATFAGSRVEDLQFPNNPELPEWAPEPGLSLPKPLPSAETAADTNSFHVFRQEKWALQDFLPTPKELAEIYPSRAEMRMLRVARLAKVGLFVAAILGLAYYAFGIVDLMRRPEWAFNPDDSAMIKQRLAFLNTEKQKGEHWDNLLDDRSKAWASMELLARMFPEQSGLLVKNFSHSVKPDSSPGQAKVGFVKEWKITGYARDEALETLNQLNTREGITSRFAIIAEATGNAAFRMDTGNRSVVPNVRTQENRTFKALPADSSGDWDPDTYPFTFDLTITQRFESTDPMAINVAAAR